MERIIKIILLSLFILANTVNSSAISVEDAYKSIPHRQTTYQSEQSSLSVAEREFLEKLFKLSDQALVARIETMKGLKAADKSSYKKYQSVIENIRSELTKLKEPSSATGIVKILDQAIINQGKYFAAWNEDLNSSNTPRSFDENVRSASSYLQQLYAELMKRYSTEGAHNKDAFYQHLCALDFI
jgi:hypothetical protein